MTFTHSIYHMNIAKLSIVVWLCSIIFYTCVWSADFDCDLVIDGGSRVVQALDGQYYGVLTPKHVHLAIAHLLHACCRWDGGTLWSQVCNQYSPPAWPQSKFFFDQLIALWFEKLTSLRSQTPLFESMPWSDYDQLANQRYQYISQEMQKYDWVLPEVIAQKFMDTWKIDEIATARIGTEYPWCDYQLSVDAWLVHRYYNVCDMAYCLTNHNTVRWLLTKQWFFNHSSNKDYLNCRSQATKLIIDHIKQAQWVIAYKSTAYQYNNWVNYVNDIVISSTMQNILETTAGITSDLSMVLQTSIPRPRQCFGN